MIRLLAVLTMVALTARPTAGHAGAVLDRVRAAGTLACGSITEPGDYTKDDTHGRTEAFGADICRAVAAALFGDAARVRVNGYPDEADGMRALKLGRIALLVGASPNPGMAARYDAAYGQPVLFDGQGFLVRRHAGITTLEDLQGRAVCFIGGTQAEDNLVRTFARRHIAFLPFPFEEMGEMEAALVTGRCIAQTGDATALAAGRTGFHGERPNFVVLPDRITLDPLCPVLPQGDAEWARIVDWTVFALIRAEVEGVTQSNAASLAHAPDLAVQTLLGTSRSAMGGLPLPDGWGLAVIRAVGNYGEVFERDLGHSSPVGLDRGLNRPWTDGGMLWAPAFR